MDTDQYVRYNIKNIQDRQIDNLIGLCKGFIADRVVNQDEAEFLHNWLVQSSQFKNPIIMNLLSKVGPMMEDGELDAEEAAELFNLLQTFSGGEAKPDEVFKTTRLPVCSPAPEIHFPGSNFLLTGTCAFGTRKQCQEEIERRGGINITGVTRKLNYLILWAHETFGRKIEKAMQYRDAGVPLSIVTEEHWLAEAGL
ncbi:MAG: NAD-dependent DNA ligase [Ectothiorhodospiraceae bacterium AqS1]|nr:NAD-dependent DNA ligase [Ectothiorhodospiraceae bacterium AqS1]